MREYALQERVRWQAVPTHLAEVARVELYPPLAGQAHAELQVVPAHSAALREYSAALRHLGGGCRNHLRAVPAEEVGNSEMCGDRFHMSRSFRNFDQADVASHSSITIVTQPRNCKPEKKTLRELSFASLVAGLAKARTFGRPALPLASLLEPVRKRK